MWAFERYGIAKLFERSEGDDPVVDSLAEFPDEDATHPTLLIAH